MKEFVLINGVRIDFDEYMKSQKKKEAKAAPVSEVKSEDSPISKPESKNLKDHTVKELKAMADEVGLEYGNKIKKEGLIDLLDQAREECE